MFLIYKIKFLIKEIQMEQKKLEKKFKKSR